MIRFCAPTIAGIVLFGVSVVSAESLPTETFKVLPAALAVEAAQAAMAACKSAGLRHFRCGRGPNWRSQTTSRWRWSWCADPKP
jgi:hypothetical protein